MTVLFRNTQPLLKSTVTTKFVFFAAVNYLSGLLRKQWFTSTRSKGHVEKIDAILEKALGSWSTLSCHCSLFKCNSKNKSILGKGQDTRRGMVPNSLWCFVGAFFLALFWTSGLPLWASDLLCLLAHCLVSKKVRVKYCLLNLKIFNTKK